MSKPFSLPRRAAALALGCAMLPAAAAPDYVFYFIGDGMGMGHVMAAQHFNRTVLGSDSALLMMRFPAVGAVTTYSASSAVTKSPAAGTALATGHKTNNSMVGVTPDTAAVQSIAMDLKARGYGIGIVTSVAADDATPGAFYAHVPSRSMYQVIDSQAVASGVDFLAGSTLGRGEQELADLMAQNSITVTNDPEVTSSGRVVLTSPENARLHPGNIGYSIDSIPGALTLTAMTRACLRHLEQTSPGHFFMMVEGGNIDHAAHANDAGTVVREIIAYQDALRLAYDFYLAHPDKTLIVVTADHDTGGMAMGNNHIPYDLQMQYLLHQRVSKAAFSDVCKGILKSRQLYTWDDMRQYLDRNFGFWRSVPLTDRQTGELQQEFEDVFTHRAGQDQRTYSGEFNPFAVKVFEILDQVTGIGWTATSHTGNLVPVYAVGCGASRFDGLLDNTQIPKIIMGIANGE